MGHVIGPFVAVEVAEMVLLQRVREPPRVGEHVARIVLERRVVHGRAILPR